MIQTIQDTLQQYWGYSGFRPLQQEAMESLASGRDTLLVLPTGGGKSLCYQAPAVSAPGLAVVISPLISLMKDQVDSLTECGIAAARIDSSLTPEERHDVMTQLNNNTLKLLYMSPERLVSNGFMETLKHTNLSFVAIDEAHCVSMWGHDFRPEYRQLAVLRKHFPDVAIGAYTATATDQVRKDIVEQLELKSPQILVGSFDRPNLIYQIKRLSDRNKQVREVMDRHKRESGIIYCIRRRDVNELSAQLNSQGYNTAPYHAGLSDRERQGNQERFINEKVDTIVATIAFGMGIDKSNVRYVIHTGMPKSLENYQQESGRAGRDDLEADCCLLYSGGDYGVWKSLMRDMEPSAYAVAIKKLNKLFGFCTGATCRHQAILQYFGQTLDKDNCQACDICLGQLDLIDNAQEITQKILSCVLRLEQRYGAGYTAQVLTGSKDKRILECRHDELSTYGLLTDQDKRVVHDWIEQLVGQGYLAKEGEYDTLGITEQGVEGLKGQKIPRLLKPTKRPSRQAKVTQDSWDGVDRDLFEALREMRSSIAAKKRVPAYVVFGDTALRDMARLRPSTKERFLDVKGVGQKKAKQYGKVVLETITSYCTDNNITMDIG
ncbi:MAG: DNA helicase RecQ [Phycisphaeraceae bacterium]|nr:DNA helicase RecQ [Phycisphaeraceae bacterium]